MRRPREPALKVYVKSLLPCSSSAAWSEVQKVSLLRYVAWPLVTFHPRKGEQLPARWEQGTTVSIRMRLFGFVPFGTHILEVERIDHDQLVIQTCEHDYLIRKWDHLIQICRETDNTSMYSDDIEIDAGILTVPVFLFAQCFYRHRQRRWRKAVRHFSAP